MQRRDAEVSPSLGVERAANQMSGVEQGLEKNKRSKAGTEQ